MNQIIYTDQELSFEKVSRNLEYSQPLVLEEMEDNISEKGIAEEPLVLNNVHNELKKPEALLKYIFLLTLLLRKE